MPTVIGRRPATSQSPGVGRAELHDPATHRLVADIEATLGQQVLDITQAQVEAEV